eukprot:PhF_6_TR2021/c0_g2_i2/m.3485
MTTKYDDNQINAGFVAAIVEDVRGCATLMMSNKLPCDNFAIEGEYSARLVLKFNFKTEKPNRDEFTSCIRMIYLVGCKTDTIETVKVSWSYYPKSISHYNNSISPISGALYMYDNSPSSPNTTMCNHSIKVFDQTLSDASCLDRVTCSYFTKIVSQGEKGWICGVGNANGTASPNTWSWTCGNLMGSLFYDGNTSLSVNESCPQECLWAANPPQTLKARSYMYLESGPKWTYYTPPDDAGAVQTQVGFFCMAILDVIGTIGTITVRIALVTRSETKTPSRDKYRNISLTRSLTKRKTNEKSATLNSDTRHFPKTTTLSHQTLSLDKKTDDNTGTSSKTITQSPLTDTVIPLRTFSYSVSGEDDLATNSFSQYDLKTGSYLSPTQEKTGTPMHSRTNSPSRTKSIGSRSYSVFLGKTNSLSLSRTRSVTLSRTISKIAGSPYIFDSISISDSPPLHSPSNTDSLLNVKTNTPTATFSRSLTHSITKTSEKTPEHESPSQSQTPSLSDSNTPTPYHGNTITPTRTHTTTLSKTNSKTVKSATLLQDSPTTTLSKSRSKSERTATTEKAQSVDSLTREKSMTDITVSPIDAKSISVSHSWSAKRSDTQYDGGSMTLLYGDTPTVTLSPTFSNSQTILGTPDMPRSNSVSLTSTLMRGRSSTVTPSHSHPLTLDKTFPFLLIRTRSHTDSGGDKTVTKTPIAIAHNVSCSFSKRFDVVPMVPYPVTCCMAPRPLHANHATASVYFTKSFRAQYSHPVLTWNAGEPGICRTSDVIVYDNAASSFELEITFTSNDASQLVYTNETIKQMTITSMVIQKCTVVLSTTESGIITPIGIPYVLSIHLTCAPYKELQLSLFSEHGLITPGFLTWIRNNDDPPLTTNLTQQIEFVSFHIGHDEVEFTWRGDEFFDKEYAVNIFPLKVPVEVLACEVIVDIPSAVTTLFVHGLPLYFRLRSQRAVLSLNCTAKHGYVLLERNSLPRMSDTEVWYTVTALGPRGKVDEITCQDDDEAELIHGTVQVGKFLVSPSLTIRVSMGTQKAVFLGGGNATVEVCPELSQPMEEDKEGRMLEFSLVIESMLPDMVQVEPNVTEFFPRDLASEDEPCTIVTLYALQNSSELLDIPIQITPIGRGAYHYDENTTFTVVTASAKNVDCDWGSWSHAVVEAEYTFTCCVYPAVPCGLCGEATIEITFANTSAITVALPSPKKLEWTAESEQCQNVTFVVGKGSSSEENEETDGLKPIITENTMAMVIQSAHIAQLPQEVPKNIKMLTAKGTLEIQLKPGGSYLEVIVPFSPTQYVALDVICSQTLMNTYIVANESLQNGIMKIPELPGTLNMIVDGQCYFVMRGPSAQEYVFETSLVNMSSSRPTPFGTLPDNVTVSLFLTAAGVGLASTASSAAMMSDDVTAAGHISALSHLQSCEDGGFQALTVIDHPTTVVIMLPGAPSQLSGEFSGALIMNSTIIIALWMIRIVLFRVEISKYIRSASHVIAIRVTLYFTTTLAMIATHHIAVGGGWRSALGCIVLGSLGATLILVFRAAYEPLELMEYEESLFGITAQLRWATTLKAKIVTMVIYRKGFWRGDATHKRNYGLLFSSMRGNSAVMPYWVPRTRSLEAIVEMLFGIITGMFTVLSCQQMRGLLLVLECGTIAWSFILQPDHTKIDRVLGNIVRVSFAVMIGVGILEGYKWVSMPALMIVLPVVISFCLYLKAAIIAARLIHREYERYRKHQRTKKSFELGDNEEDATTQMQEMCVQLHEKSKSSYGEEFI